MTDYVVCILCGRKGSRAYLISSGNGDGTRDTYCCSAANACERRGTLISEAEAVKARAKR